MWCWGDVFAVPVGCKGSKYFQPFLKQELVMLCMCVAGFLFWLFLSRWWNPAESTSLILTAVVHCPSLCVREVTETLQIRNDGEVQGLTLWNNNWAKKCFNINLLMSWKSKDWWEIFKVLWTRRCVGRGCCHPRLIFFLHFTCRNTKEVDFDQSLNKVLYRKHKWIIDGLFHLCGKVKFLVAFWVEKILTWVLCSFHASKILPIYLIKVRIIVRTI